MGGPVERIALPCTSSAAKVPACCAFDSNLLGKVWMMLFLMVTAPPHTGVSRIFLISSNTSCSA